MESLIYAAPAALAVAAAWDVARRHYAHKARELAARSSDVLASHDGAIAALGKRVAEIATSQSDLVQRFAVASGNPSIASKFNRRG